MTSELIQKATLIKKEDGTLEIKIIVPWKNVEKVREEVVATLAKTVSVAGFRTGKAPQKVAEPKIPKERVNEELLKRIITDSYNKAVKEKNLNPIITPRIHIEAFADGTDLVFSAETCEEPEVALNDYKDEVKKVTAKSKIVVPGKEQEKPKLDEILSAALGKTKVTIPKILIEQEANRLLSQLLDELKALGMSLDSYLASKGKTGDALRAEYEQKAEQDLKLEFMLRAIANEEKITVEQKDIDEVVNSLKDEAQKEEVVKNPYMLASIIRQQKTLDFLAKL